MKSLLRGLKECARLSLVVSNHAGLSDGMTRRRGTLAAIQALSPAMNEGEMHVNHEISITTKNHTEVRLVKSEP